MKEIELISLYFYFCECYNKELRWYNQRFSHNSTPNNEKLTDEEILTIYFYCRRYEKKHLKSEIWDFANRYMRSWFPNIPAYATFNTRLNNLSDALLALVALQLDTLKDMNIDLINEQISLVDSLPIMLCCGKRQAKVATEISDKTFCATKGIYYFGVKLHVVAFQRPKMLPLPEFISVTNASEFDLTALKPILPKLIDRAIFADKAYADKPLNEQLLKQMNTYIYTPVKLVKGESPVTRQFKKAADDLFSNAVSTVRQPIESLFNFLIEKTKIQNASKVRASKGLFTHIWTGLATALLNWIF